MTRLRIKTQREGGKKRKEKKKKPKQQTTKTNPERVLQAPVPEGVAVLGGTRSASIELQAELELGKKLFSCSVNNFMSSEMFSCSIRA